MSRRNVLSAGAWSLPVLAVAVHAPAAAASELQQMRLVVEKEFRANRFFILWPQLTNTGDRVATFSMTITSNLNRQLYSIDDYSPSGEWSGDDPDVITLAPGQASTARSFVIQGRAAGLEPNMLFTVQAPGYADAMELVALPKAPA